MEVFTAFVTEKKPLASIKLNGWKDVHQDWTEPYNNVSLQNLTDFISRFEGSNASDEIFYARTIALVQSSGMGKSRLIAEFGKRYPSINFCLRTGRHGYPPPDSAVVKSLLAPIPDEVSPAEALANQTIERKRGLFLMWAHALAAAHLQASFDYCRYPFPSREEKGRTNQQWPLSSHGMDRSKPGGFVQPGRSRNEVAQRS